MASQLPVPVIDNSEYEVSDNTWQQLRSEIIRLKDLIGAGTDLTPADVQNVKALAKQVREYGVLYRRAITTAATEYKSKLEEELDQLDYNVIEQYIDTKRQEQQKATSDRLNAKLVKFNEIVRAELAKTTQLKNSALSNYVANNLSSRFPKLNSGAKSKEITHWAPIESVVHMSVAAADQVLVANPILVQLPPTSKSLRAVSNYLQTGDVHQTEDMKAVMVEDTPLIQRLVLVNRVATDDSTVTEIKTIIDSDVDSKTKLARIQTILDVYNTTK